MLETGDFLPEGIDLFLAVFLDLVDGLALKDALAADKDRLQKFTGREVLEGLLFPGVVRVEEQVRLGVVDDFVRQGEDVRLCLAGLLVIETPDFLDARGGDLRDVFGDLDLRDDFAVFLDGAEFVDAVQDRRRLRRDHAFADAEGGDLSTLLQHVGDEVFVERVGRDDAAVREPGVVEHLSRLLGEIGDVAGVDADARRTEPSRDDFPVEGFDGVRHTGLQDVEGVDEQRAALRIFLCVGKEGVELGVEHLDPAVGHGAEGRDAVVSAVERTGRTDRAADVRGTRAVDGRHGAVRTAGAELHDRSAVRRADDTVRLGGDEALMVEEHQHGRLDELRLDDRTADVDDRLVREDRCAFRNGPDVAGELKGPEIVEEVVRKAAGLEVVEVLLGKVQAVQVVHHLLEAGRDDVAAVVRHMAVEQVEVADGILQPVMEIATTHGQLIEVCEHGDVEVSVEVIALVVVTQRERLLLQFSEIIIAPRKKAFND